MKTITFAMAGLIALAAVPPAARATTLTVTFTVTDAPTGQILLNLYDSEAAHDAGGTPVSQAAVPVKDGQAIARFEGLAPGRYAIKAFHDLNGDGELNSNPFGMPIEPFAFSNNAPAQGGPAKWQAASFAVDGSEAATAITIR
jgi:uncharacterized protein (DUF2141 family)